MPLTLGVEASAISALIPGPLYLDPAVGYATTPDAPAWAVAGDFNLAARCILPAATGANRFLAAQWPTSPTADQSWLWFITSAGIMQMTLRQTGNFQSTGNVLTAAEVNAFGSAAVYIGVRCTRNTGRFAALTSIDGLQWNEVGTPVTGQQAWTSTLDSAAPVHIGSRSVTGTDRFNAPIFFVEMRKGLNPGAGALVFRFDGSDWSSGTSWTDPRGLPWSLSAAGAIHT